MKAKEKLESQGWKIFLVDVGFFNEKRDILFFEKRYIDELIQPNLIQIEMMNNYKIKVDCFVDLETIQLAIECAKEWEH